MSLDAEANAQAEASAAAKKQDAATPPLNPPFPFQPTPIDLWFFGLNKDIDPQFTGSLQD
ncbi:MAG TPA: hypothetical protein VGM54_09910 [Chthoniobacter sp.]|jgi:hypothetical protein